MVFSVEHSCSRGSEANLPVDVEGVENRDARLLSLDRRPTVPAHHRERMIGLQDHESVAEVGKERYGLHGLKTVRAHMHQALERDTIKGRAEVFPVSVGRTI